MKTRQRQLPRRSIARCRCVSKLWNSTLHSPYFIEFLTRPRLLFSFRKDRELCFFSSPQDENSSPVDADYHLKLKLKTPLNLWSCPRTVVAFTKSEDEEELLVKSFLGFDPTDEEFKVLTITGGIEHRVLTLGTRKLEWRMVECGIPDHYPIVMGYASMVTKKQTYCVVGSRDAETLEWSKHVYVLPQPLWKNVVGETMLYFVGVTGGTDEVVLWPYSLRAPFYVYYYNMERNTLRRVEIKGMDAVRDYTAYMSLDYVEDVKLMKHV
ncbi:unnamed protein product [Microthlaspi erraticum]|uniref:Uncharacterized protein n=1 Tax=Microthlaspi erraticum TaxID=1685480 RepID=A0A6D2HMT6_9BRAS|nr:unnamed protein product [Microthlaspi erraticum]